MKAININPHNNPNEFTYWLGLVEVHAQTHDDCSETIIFSLLGGYPDNGFIKDTLHYNLFEYDITTDKWDSPLPDDVPDVIKIKDIDLVLLSNIVKVMESDEQASDHLYMIPMDGTGDGVHFYAEEIDTFCDVLKQVVPTIRKGGFENWVDIDLGPYEDWEPDDEDVGPWPRLVVNNDDKDK